MHSLESDSVKNCRQTPALRSSRAEKVAIRRVNGWGVNLSAKQRNAEVRKKRDFNHSRVQLIRRKRLKPPVAARADGRLLQSGNQRQVFHDAGPAQRSPRPQRHVGAYIFLKPLRNVLYGRAATLPCFQVFAESVPNVREGEIFFFFGKAETEWCHLSCVPLFIFPDFIFSATKNVMPITNIFSVIFLKRGEKPVRRAEYKRRRSGVYEPLIPRQVYENALFPKRMSREPLGKSVYLPDVINVKKFLHEVAETRENHQSRVIY